MTWWPSVGRCRRTICVVFGRTSSYPEMTGEPGLTVDDDATELDRRARRDAGIDPEKPLATMSRAEAAAYVAAARRELSEDPWLRARLGHA